MPQATPEAIKEYGYDKFLSEMGEEHQSHWDHVPGYKDLFGDEQEKYAPKQAEQQTDVVEERGFFGDVGSQLARGAADLTRMTGHALKVADPDGGIDVVEQFGQKMIDTADKSQSMDIMKMDESEAAGENWFSRGWKSGVRSAIPSLGAAIGGAVAGAGITAGAGVLGFGGVLAATVPMIGMSTGQVAGMMAGTGGIFGLGTYGEKKQEYLDHGLDEHTAEKAAIKQGIIEGGGEMIATFLGLAILGPGKMFSQPLKETVTELLQTPAKTMVKKLAGTALEETITEMIQEGSQAAVETGIGLREEGAWLEGALEAIVPAITMSLMFAGGSSTFSAVKKRQLKAELNNLEDSKAREKAVEEIESGIREASKDKNDNGQADQQAEAWTRMAFDKIDAGETIDLQENFVEFAALDDETRQSFADKEQGYQAQEQIKSFDQKIANLERMQKPTPRQVAKWEQLQAERAQLANELADPRQDGNDSPGTRFNEGQAEVDQGIEDFRRQRADEAYAQDQQEQEMLGAKFQQNHQRESWDNKRKSEKSAESISGYQDSIVEKKQQKRKEFLAEVDKQSKVKAKNDSSQMSAKDKGERDNYQESIANNTPAAKKKRKATRALELMREQAANSQSRSTSVDQDGTRHSVAATSPGWMKDIGGKLSRAEIDNLITKYQDQVIEGNKNNRNPLTEKQLAKIEEYILPAMDRVQEDHADEFMEQGDYEKEGFKFIDKEMVAIDLEAGDQLLGYGGVQGISEVIENDGGAIKVRTPGENGEVITIDGFDAVAVDAFKEGNGQVSDQTQDGYTPESLTPAVTESIAAMDEAQLTEYIKESKKNDKTGRLTSYAKDELEIRRIRKRQQEQMTAESDTAGQFMDDQIKRSTAQDSLEGLQDATTKGDKAISEATDEMTQGFDKAKSELPQDTLKTRSAEELKAEYEQKQAKPLQKPSAEEAATAGVLESSEKSPVKGTKEKAEPKVESTLSLKDKDQQALIDKKVTKLGSVDAVDKAYTDDATVDSEDSLSSEKTQVTEGEKVEEPAKAKLATGNQVTEREKAFIATAADTLVNQQIKDYEGSEQPLSEEEVEVLRQQNTQTYTSLVKAIKRKDFKTLADRLHRGNPESLKLFRKITSRGTKNAAEIKKSIRALDTKAYDKWKSDLAEEKKQAKRAKEKSAREAERQDMLEQPMQYKGKRTTFKGIIDTMIAKEGRKLTISKRGIANIAVLENDEYSSTFRKKAEIEYIQEVMEKKAKETKPKEQEAESKVDKPGAKTYANIDEEQENTSVEDFDNILDDVFGKETKEPIQPPKTAKKSTPKAPEQTASKPDTTKDLVNKVAIESLSGVKEAVKGLGALFTPKNTLSSGFVFNEETYAAAKPHFEQAWSHAREAGFSLKKLVQHLASQFGSEIRPYLKRYYTELKENKSQTKESPQGTVEEYLHKHFRSGEGFKNITEARNMVNHTQGTKIKAGTAEAKKLDEQIEQAVVLVGREIVNTDKTTAQKYDALLDLQDRMPNLSVRTSTSMKDQAYSTPLPLAFLASELAGITQKSTVVEPTAGNGALLMGANPANVIANELNETRANFLKQQGFKNTTQKDATTILWQKKEVDSVITNPPFGTLKGRSWTFYDHSTKQIDQAIALQSLKAMKQDGKAVLILGSINDRSVKESYRKAQYRIRVKAGFYKALYDNYNVVDHFSVAGKMYAKQGAAWPVDVIVIHGKGKSSKVLPGVTPPAYIKTYDELKGKLNEKYDSVDAGRGEDASGTLSTAGNMGEARDEDNSQGSSGTSGGQSTENDGQRPEGRPGQLQGNNDRVGEDLGRPDSIRPVQGTDSSSAGTRRGSNDNAQSGLPSGAELDAGRLRESGKEGKQAQPGSGKSNQQPGESSGVGVRHDNPVKTKKKAGSDHQTEYKPASKSGAVGTLVPSNMSTAMKDALKSLSMTQGDIDQYVAIKLGYTTDEINGKDGKFGYFSGEQIDAIALAIHNLDNDNGFIIGDQTGVGKGRVVAAMLRYAMRKGLTPIFLTEKPNLYGDMYRDFSNIGMPEISNRILMTNAGARISLTEDGSKFLKTESSSKHNALLRDIANAGELPSGYDMLFTTYDQLSAQGSVRRDALESLVRGGMVVMDESHNAGGTAARPQKGKYPRSKFLKDILPNATSVFYSSATYAKSPDVMDLYMKTDMRHIVPEIKELGELIKQGGVPLQQVIAAMLVEAKQYVRRERSFKGVEYNVVPTKVDRGHTNAVGHSFKSIKDFSDTIVEIALGGIQDDVAGDAGTASGLSSASDTHIQSTSFSSVMHNLVDQFLLAQKADGAVEKAIEAHKRGEKVVLTLANTMGSFIGQYAEEGDLTPGDGIGISFKDLIFNYLDKTRRYTETTGSGEKITRYISDAELGIDGVKEFEKIKKLIYDLPIDGLPVSPIDYMKFKLEQAGIKTGEITGRKDLVEYREEGISRYKRRSAKETDVAAKQNTVYEFNTDKTDALILNRSGASGLSLHALPKWEGHVPAKRHMIIVQAEKNIDTHMQMLGRVHRVGQITEPVYSQLMGTTPTENRPAAVLARKMASLNANTTAGTESDVTAEGTMDFMNKYGDRVVAAAMDSFPEIHKELGSPLPMGVQGFMPEGAASKVTGKMPMLPVDRQEALYKLFDNEYKLLIEQLDATGENDLDAKTYDTDARVLGRTKVIPKTGTSPFQAAAYAERVDMKKLSKSFTAEEVQQELKQEVYGDRKSTKTIEETMLESAAVARKNISNSLSTFQNYSVDILDDIESSQRRSMKEAQLTGVQESWTEIATAMYTGASINIPINDTIYMSRVLKVAQQGKPKNPLALGTWRVTFAVPDSIRRVTYSFAQLGRIDWYRTAQTSYDFKAFDNASSSAREERIILTGNLPAVFSEYKRAKGRIINFTDNKGKIKQGIIMPAAFNLNEATKERSIPHTAPEQAARVVTAGFPIVTTDGLSISHNADDTHRFFVSTPASRAKGGTYFLDEKLLDVVGDDFVRTSNRMQVVVSKGTMKKLVAHVINERGEIFRSVAQQDAVRELLGIQIEQEQITNEGTAIEGQVDFSIDKPPIKIEGKEAGKTAGQIDYSMNPGNKEQGRKLTPAQATDSMYAIVQKYVQTGKLRTTKALTRHQKKVQRIWRDVFKQKVVYFEGKNSQRLEGFYWSSEKSTVYINARVARPALQIAAHELGHTIQKENPEIYNWLVKEINGFLKTEGYQKFIASKKKNYTDKGRDASLEFFPEMLAEVMSKPAFWDQLYASNPTMAAKVTQWLQEIFDKINAYLKGELLSDYFTDIDAVSKVMATALLDVNRKAHGQKPIIKSPVRTRDVSESGKFDFMLSDPISVPDNSTVWQTLKHNLVNRLDSFKIAQKAAGNVSPEADVLTKETLRISKAKAYLEDAYKRYHDQINKLIADNNKTIAQVDEYLYSRHAPEANERLKYTTAKEWLLRVDKLRGSSKMAKEVKRIDAELELNPAMEPKKAYWDVLQKELDTMASPEELKFLKSYNEFIEKPSGMTTNDAIEAQKKYTNDETMKDIAALFDKMNDEKLKLSYEAGRMTKETYDAVKGTFEYYAPLKREGFDSSPTVGRGTTNKGVDVMARGGSTKKAVDLLANALADFDTTVVKAHKAESARAFKLFIEGLGENNFLNLIEPPTRAVYDKGGNIKHELAYNIDENHEVAFKVDGVQYIAQANKNNEHAKRMIQHIAGNSDKTGIIVEYLNKVNRVLAMVNTSLSPEFMISNFMRDAGTAFVNLSDTEMADVKKKIFTNIPSAMKGIHSALRGDSSHEWAKHFKEYRDSGAMIGWMDNVTDIEQKVKALDKEIDLLRPSKDLSTKKLYRQRVLVKKTAKAALDVVMDYNSMVENAVRLSTYKAAIDAGITEEKAALMAKELTVNFNQRGTMGAVINSLYLFSNAGIQGSAKIISVLKNSKRARQIVGASVILSAGLMMANRGIGGDDEDDIPYYDKVDQFIKERNIVFMIPGGKGKYVKVPLPWGYNVFWAFGEELGNAFVNKKYNALEGAGRMLTTTLNAFNPLQSSTIAQTISPTITDPFVQVAENKTWSGSPLMPEGNPFEKIPTPDSEKYWESVRAPSKWIARLANTMSLGNSVKPGKIDVSPETLDLVWDMFTGGAGKFLANTINVPIKMLSGDDISLREKPFIRKVLGEKTEYVDSKLFRKNKTHIHQLHDQAKTYPHKARKYRADKAFRLIGSLKQVEGRIRKLNKKKKFARTDMQKEQITKAINNLMINFNRLYNRIT